MASVVTIISRFCYRSPTRPLFVASLILLILITWKFLVAQPDANALLMHSKDKTWLGRKQALPAKQLHIPLQSPVKKDEGRKRLVNKLPENENLDEMNKSSKENDSGYGKLDKVVVGEMLDGGTANEPAQISKQTKIMQRTNLDKRGNAVAKGIVREGKGIEVNGRKNVQDNESAEQDLINKFNTNRKYEIENQSATGIGGKKDQQKENMKKEQNISNKMRLKLTTRSSINHLDFQQHLDSKSEQKSPSNMNNLSPSLLTINQINKMNPQPISDFPVGQYNILLTLVKMSHNSHLAQSMRKFLKSVCRHTSIKLTLHAIVDDVGKLVVLDFFKTVNGLCRDTQVVIHNVNQVVDQLKPLTKLLQSYFGVSNSYYNDPIFFMSTAIHKVFYSKLKQIIMMDVDLRFVSDIKLLFDMYKNFKQSNIIGLAREQSPVYRHILYKYRAAHPGTVAGDPPPKGITGFNSGVVLFNLENMRKSTLYNHILEGKEIKRLADKYSFRGHLGDQDFFSLLSMEYQELFYIVPCSWNRQLCTYWRDNGYAKEWDYYASCKEPIHVYHGNCRTSFPNGIDR